MVGKDGENIVLNTNHLDESFMLTNVCFDSDETVISTKIREFEFHEQIEIDDGFYLIMGSEVE